MVLPAFVALIISINTSARNLLMKYRINLISLKILRRKIFLPCIYLFTQKCELKNIFLRALYKWRWTKKHQHSVGLLLRIEPLTPINYKANSFKSKLDLKSNCRDICSNTSFEKTECINNCFYCGNGSKLTRIHKFTNGSDERYNNGWYWFQRKLKIFKLYPIIYI